MVLTPNGDNVIFVSGPMQGGCVGGEPANVSPAIDQVIGHAVTLIVNGERPEGPGPVELEEEDEPEYKVEDILDS